MTDDFQLFPDSAGGPAIDADIALITAYLARELSLVQIVAVEERLATDAAFRAKVRPIIEAWLVPTSFGAKALRGTPSRAWEAVTVTRAEIDAGWQRHLSDTEDRRTRALPRSSAEATHGSTTRRRPSMARIAAVIAAITIPMVTVAQVVVYVAKRPDAPGHSVAQRIVAPFGQKEQPARAQTSEPRVTEASPIPSPDDVPLVQPLPASTPGDRSARGVEAATPAVTTTRPSVGVPQPTQRATPDRARIAALATQRLPDVVRGETAADYILVVLDASDQYVWSTHGIGDFSMEVAGDTRTPGERSAFNREYRAEYTGAAAGAAIAYGRGRSGGANDSLAAAYASGYSQSDSAERLSRLRARLERLEAGSAAAGSGGRGGSVATARPGQADSVGVVAGARSGGGGGRGGTVEAGAIAGARSGGTGVAVGAVSGRGGGVGTGVARGAGGGRGGFVVGEFDYSASQAGVPGTYRMGFSSARYADSGMLNQAYGLQEAGGGQSGIQGLLSSSVAMAELYTFPAGALAPQHLRIVVVHLTPGAEWKGR